MSGLALRPMEPADTEQVCLLLERAFPHSDLSRGGWQTLLPWLYFTPGPGDSGPRAFVIAEGNELIGHIGCIISELSCGASRLRVVQPVNWAIEPGRKVGLLGIGLMTAALSTADVALTIGGSRDTLQLIPKFGFTPGIPIHRYLRVLKPARFLKTAWSSDELTRSAAKLGMSAFAGQVGRFRASSRDHALAGSVLRNHLGTDFVAWYQQCPYGTVHLLRSRRGDRVLGRALLLLLSSGGHRYANILGVDVSEETSSAWSGVLDDVEEFVRSCDVTHVNALASYAPWGAALERHGYGKLSRVPFWLRDRSGLLKEVNAWHLTAMEGDLGYVLK